MEINKIKSHILCLLGSFTDMVYNVICYSWSNVLLLEAYNDTQVNTKTSGLHFFKISPNEATLIWDFS